MNDAHTVNGTAAKAFHLCVAKNDDDASSQRPGSRPAVLDERASRHAFRL
jgi:hypothetical protein